MIKPCKIFKSFDRLEGSSLINITLIFMEVLLTCILLSPIGCAPSINSSLDRELTQSKPIRGTEVHHIERAVKVDKNISKEPLLGARSHRKDLPSPLQTPPSSSFSPSDRIWGSMLLPAQTVKQLRINRRSIGFHSHRSLLRIFLNLRIQFTSTEANS